MYSFGIVLSELCLHTKFNVDLHQEEQFVRAIFSSKKEVTVLKCLGKVLSQSNTC